MADAFSMPQRDPDPPSDLRAAGEARTFADCDAALHYISEILKQYRLNGETHALHILRWKLRTLEHSAR